MNAARSNLHLEFATIGSAAAILESSLSRLLLWTGSAPETAAGFGAFGPTLDLTDFRHAYHNRRRRAGAMLLHPASHVSTLAPASQDFRGSFLRGSK